MNFPQFERRLLEIAFTSDLPITPQTMAYAMGIPTSEAKTLLDQAAAAGTLELDSDESGNLRYTLDGRAEVAKSVRERDPRGWRVPAAWSHGHRPFHRGFRSPWAVALLLLNVFLLPGLGSIIGGRVAVGVLQVALTLVALPLCFVLIGLPLLAVAWAWSFATGLEMIGDPEPML